MTPVTPPSHTTDQAPTLPALRSRLVAAGGTSATVADIAGEIRASTWDTPAAVIRSARDAHAHLVGLGPLQPLAQLPGVTDILVNNPSEVYVDRGQGLQLSDITFAAEADVRALAVRLAAQSGQRLDDSSPYVDGQLPGGVRLHAVLPPVAAAGTALSLRLPAPTALGLTDLIGRGAAPPEIRDLLTAIVSARVAFCISGGTGTGKTTLLQAMLTEAASDERVCVVEDAAELRLHPLAAVHLVARRANVEGRGEVTLTDLVRQSLRMRPDRVVVGECRGAEVRDLLLALNTGHRGGCTTIHANSAEDVPRRLAALALLAGLAREAACEQISGSFTVLLHLTRTSEGRHLSQIGVLRDAAVGQLPVAEPAWTWGGQSPPVIHPAMTALEALVS